MMTIPEAVPVPAPTPTPKVGDILVSSWGYDQTNIDWYKVVAVTKASIRIVQISGRTVEQNGPSDRVMPNTEEVPNPADKGALKRFRLSEKGYSVSINSYANAYLWDGNARHQTGWGYGH
jgi:hypothetical protein